MDTLAINDLTSGLSFANFMIRKYAYWNRLRACGVAEIWVSTCTPNTTSTDSWATVGNQTVTSANTALQAYNSLLRNTDLSAYGITRVLDVAAAVESSPASGKWIANYYTTDGLHPSATAHAAMAAAVSSAFAAATL